MANENLSQRTINKLQDKLNNNLENKLKEMYIDKMYSFREIMPILGVTNRTVRKLLQYYDIPIRYGGEAVKSQWHNNDKRRKEWGDLNKKLKTGKPSLKRKSDEDILNQCNINSYVFMKKRYVNKKIKYIVKCKKCKSILKLEYNGLKKIHCDGKIKSKGELEVMMYLQKRNIPFETQYYIKHKTKMFFDFAIKINNELILIEYDGVQHFDKKSNYYNDNVVENDINKNNCCKKNNIKLIRIPYIFIDRISDILDYHLSI